jgi:hypothetical protein
MDRLADQMGGHGQIRIEIQTCGSLSPAAPSGYRWECLLSDGHEGPCRCEVDGATVEWPHPPAILREPAGAVGGVPPPDPVRELIARWREKAAQHAKHGDCYRVGQGWGLGEAADELDAALAAAPRGAPQGDHGKLYYELLFAVYRKHPNESRHETALRYIRNAERGSDQATASAPVASASTRSEKEHEDKS